MRLLRIIDLTHTIRHNMLDFPTNPKIAFIKERSLEYSEYNLYSILLNTHIGTHLDAPFHSIEGGKTVDRVSFKNLIGEAVVAKLLDKNSGSTIEVRDLEPYMDDIEDTQRLLISTGWDRHFGTMKYFKGYPSLNQETSIWLRERGLLTLGFDTPSPSTLDHRSTHLNLFTGDIVIIEGLKNLKKIRGSKVFFIALPLKLKGLDASPIRAIAIEGFDKN